MTTLRSVYTGIHDPASAKLTKKVALRGVWVVIQSNAVTSSPVTGEADWDPNVTLAFATTCAPTNNSRSPAIAKFLRLPLIKRRRFRERLTRVKGHPEMDLRIQYSAIKPIEQAIIKDVTPKARLESIRYHSGNGIVKSPFGLFSCRTNMNRYHRLRTP